MKIIYSFHVMVILLIFLLAGCAMMRQERRVNDQNMRTYEWESQIDNAGIRQNNDNITVPNSSGACAT